MQLSVTIVRVLETKEIGASQFKVREIHADTEEQYTQRLAIQFTQDKCALLDNFKAGEKVKIDINLKGREANNKDGEPVVYNTIQGWRIEKVS
jgi:translation initiation factor IF-3